MGTETDRLLAEARKPYADKIMELEAALAAANSYAEALREALDHTEAQRDTARAERDRYFERIQAARVKLDPDPPA